MRFCLVAPWLLPLVLACSKLTAPSFDEAPFPSASGSASAVRPAPRAPATAGQRPAIPVGE